ncbi:hypothetical protein HDV00_007779 [Rhizophlyctis rosea]|nr:hypothetical protein HDV00_007779 [Rhizophlyctis rosea]
MVVAQSRMSGWNSASALVSGGETGMSDGVCVGSRAPPMPAVAITHVDKQPEKRRPSVIASSVPTNPFADDVAGLTASATAAPKQSRMSNPFADPVPHAVVTMGASHTTLSAHDARAVADAFRKELAEPEWGDGSSVASLALEEGVGRSGSVRSAMSEGGWSGSGVGVGRLGGR